jgi:hypothetical protein
MEEKEIVRETMRGARRGTEERDPCRSASPEFLLVRYLFVDYLWSGERIGAGRGARRRIEERKVFRGAALDCL